MAEDILEFGRIIVTRLYLGAERGTGYQLNVGEHYVTLTRDEMRSLIAAFNGPLADELR